MHRASPYAKTYANLSGFASPKPYSTTPKSTTKQRNPFQSRDNVNNATFKSTTNKKNEHKSTPFMTPNRNPVQDPNDTMEWSPRTDNCKEGVIAPWNDANHCRKEQLKFQNMMIGRSQQ